ncbi:uncharacterized protein LOC135397448 [Ornithodoros turicata]|uniref:uncharacterized protein LOC135397448 n=1 Tax=Ornithodoros turicata TaxID=34597 RepID=UPI00313912CB
MPKRYRQWLFDDNVPKPRTTKFRHERSAKMSSLSSELEHAPPTGDEGPSEAPGEGGSETSGDEDRQSVWESGQVDCGAGSSMDDTNIGAHRSDTPRQQEGSLEWANITESSSTDTSDDDSASMTEDVAKTELDEPLYPGSRITRGESLVLILAHSLRHGATKEATESVLKLLEAHLPEHAALPTSKYLFFKEFLSSHQTMSYHFYCPKCLEYLGSREEEPLRCNTCSVEFDMNTLTKEFSYFLFFILVSK